VKLGEEARVDLLQFDVSSPARAAVRSALDTFKRYGLEVDIVQPGDLGQILTSLRSVSSSWYSARRPDEPEPPSDFFSGPYLRCGPVAVVRQDDTVVAFANLWQSGGLEEVMVDLIRLDPGLPPDTLTAFVAQLMLWSKNLGYRWFNLGIAPPAGVEPRRRSALWNEAANVLYRHGEHFAEFRELRRFKESFGPAWEPRYLASPGGLLLPMVFRNLTRLVSGSLRGSLGKGVEKVRA